MFKRSLAIFCLLLGSTLLPVAANAAAAPGVDTLLHEAVAGSWRSAANKARDTYRHPIQTLEFFGLKPDMTVVELSPGGGWYTEILAPVLRDHGQLIEAAPPLDSSSSFMRRMATRFDDKLKADPAVFGKVKLAPFAPPDQVALGPDGSADMVLTFRNAHDWLNNDPQTLAKVFEAAFKILKHGGVFGVVEHRAKPFADAETSSKALHRIPEDYMIELGLKTGFRLDGVSEINANPKDPEDINVHRLPPDLAGPDSEHAKMKAIGESDRMTIRFVKP
ncbi:MAG TPA: hypothetical protein VFL15_07120 [Gammaproteobacteria bacterium]|nr:hypothetical protein [Gammaproteobacteria bacterium]